MPFLSCGHLARFNRQSGLDPVLLAFLVLGDVGVAHRGERLRRNLAGRRAILVDDGLASGSTMRVAVAAVRRQEPSEIVVAVPTGHARTVSALVGEVDRLYCANIRGGLGFAVAEAYQSWYDEDEDAVTRILEGLGVSGEGPQAG